MGQGIRDWGQAESHRWPVVVELVLWPGPDEVDKFEPEPHCRPQFEAHERLHGDCSEVDIDVRSHEEQHHHRSEGDATGNVEQARREEEDYKFKPAKLMDLRDHTAVVVHPSKRFVRKRIVPVDGRGKVPSWFRKWGI